MRQVEHLATKRLVHNAAEQEMTAAKKRLDAILRSIMSHRVEMPTTIKHQIGGAEIQDKWRRGESGGVCRFFS